MIRKLTLTAVAGVAFLASAASAQAQGFGYNGYGWGGWGGATTAQGDIARGMGEYAAGAGFYNVQTAQARSINANTAMNWNEYWWQSQQNLNRQHYARMAARRDSNNQSQKQIYERLRDNPTERDVLRGDAMNLVLDTLSNPKIYVPGLKAASTKIPGEMIRDVPFRYNAANVTASVHGIMTKGSAPAALKVDALNAEMGKLRELGEAVMKDHEASGEIDPTLLDEVDAAVAAVQAKVATLYAQRSTERRDADRFLSSAAGLSKMLRTPAINVLLSDVEDRPEVTVGDMLGFMRAFNLRFGMADTPRERAAYLRLFPLLTQMRDEAMPNAKSEMPETDYAVNHAHPGEFFSELSANKAEFSHAPVPPPAPGPGAAKRP